MGFPPGRQTSAPVWIPCGIQPRPAGRILVHGRCFPMSESDVVVPFPLCRRRAFVRRIATRAAEMSADAGERHIHRQIELQAATLARKGVSEERIAAEAKALES